MKTRMFINYAIICALSLSQVSCGKKEFSPLKQFEQVNAKPGGVNADFCTLDPNLVNQQLKILFTIDISGSNVISAGGRPATDPDGERRFASLSRWLDKRLGSPNEFYTMLEFSGDSSKIPAGLINHDPDYTPFTNEKDYFKSIVDQEKTSHVDAGGTPYLAAMKNIISTIKEDAKKAKDRADKGEPAIKSTYAVIFVSDGAPTDTDEAGIVALIQNELMQLPNDPQIGPYITQINLNTGYYYIGVDLPDARKTLEEMAKAGKGEAYSFDTGDIDYDRLVDATISKVSTTLTDIIINNVNMVWDYKARTLLPDSDGDFLSDKAERELGSNSKKYDSDENGVGDGVESILNSKGWPCRDKACDPKRATAYNGCFDKDTNELLDKDDDRLSDCEEKALGTDFERVDSNSDGIPDYLAVKFSVPAAKEANGGNVPPSPNSDSDFDGLSNYIEVKRNGPPRLDNSLISKLKLYNYKITQTDYIPSSGVACYDLSVTDVSFAKPDDNIIFFIKENEINQTAKQFYRILELPARDFNLNLNRVDFSDLKPRN